MVAVVLVTEAVGAGADGGGVTIDEPIVGVGTELEFTVDARAGPGAFEKSAEAVGAGVLNADWSD